MQLYKYSTKAQENSSYEKLRAMGELIELVNKEDARDPTELAK